MKKIGGITFHASHNYGSCLQAYALQEYIKDKFQDYEYKIINFRTKKQKEIYCKPLCTKSIFGFLVKLFYLKSLNLKYKKLIHLVEAISEGIAKSILKVMDIDLFNIIKI